MLIISVGKYKSSIDAEELNLDKVSVEELATLASTASLLGDMHTFVLDGALASEHGDEFLDLAEGLVRSSHTFIFNEEKLLKRPTDILTKAGAVIEVHAIVKKSAPFDVFLIANMFALRDRKNFWLLLMQAFRMGTSPEAIAGMLHWKVRDLLSKMPSQEFVSQKSSDLAPSARQTFVRQTPVSAGKYTRDELKNLSRELVTMYHDSHRGLGSLEILLERFALTL